ncbi:alpha/beta fold hydrolase [Ensifer canadensis]|uniref:alpha/beta hydrolase n=1 Tax=Ensifer canadensis TaxID=555315 RepID=UPI0035E3DE2C
MNMNLGSTTPTRRDMMTGTLGIAAATTAVAASSARAKEPAKGAGHRSDGEYVTSKDGTAIFYKDWGPKSAQPLVFHHGWPLSGDDWDAQMLFFLGKGFRVVAHDRRGHGRSAQVSDGHDMDHYAADVAAVVEHLDLRNAVHIGHSTGAVRRLTMRPAMERGAFPSLSLSALSPRSWSRLRPTLAAFQSRSSTACAPVWRLTGLNSTSILPAAPSMVSTGRERNALRRWSKTGGARAWLVPQTPTILALRRSLKPTLLTI